MMLKTSTSMHPAVQYSVAPLRGGSQFTFKMLDGWVGGPKYGKIVNVGMVGLVVMYL